jgi:hypothetical protein
MRLAAAVLALLVCSAAGCRPALAADERHPTVRLSAPGAAWGHDAAFAGAGTGLPGWLRWALTPRLQSADGPGAAGLTDHSYHVLAWTVPLASSLLQPNDRLSFGFSLGNDVGGLLAGEDGRDPGMLPPTPTTRLGAVIGYQVTPRLGLYVTFDHVSVSGIAREDEIANDLGMRLGLRF